MGSFSIVHWAILLVVIILVFGTSKLRGAGKDLGGAVKGFKDAVKEEDKVPENKHRVLTHEDVAVDTTVENIKIPVTKTPKVSADE